MADLEQLLVSAARADPNAEKTIKDYEQANLVELVKELVVILATEGKDISARQLAGLLIKNMLQAKDEGLQIEKHDRWKALDAAVRDHVKQGLLVSMRSPVERVSHIAAVASAEVAAVELPYGQWPDFLPTLMENVKPVHPEILVTAALECLGYTCERVAALNGPDLNEATVDAMLTAIVDAIQTGRPERVRLSAATALRNSLVFSAKNMNQKVERDAIMNRICEATRSQDASVRTAAYECIALVASLYYEKLQDYMTTLYELTTETIRNDKEEVAKAAIEFWSSLAETEQELLDEAADLEERGLPVEKPCMRYVSAALVHLAPILMETLAKQNEEDDEDEFNLHMAGYICLDLISQTVEDAIVPVMMPFVNQNIQNENWRLRDAAVMAFVSILDGPSQEVIGPYVSQSVPVLLNLLSDQHVMVRDSAAHCISRICLLHVQFIPSEIFPTLLQALLTKCGEGSAKVASQACAAIHNLATAFAGQEQETNALSAYMPQLLQTLLHVADRQDADESNLRSESLQAITVLISNSAADVKPLLVQLLQPILERMETAANMQNLNPHATEKKQQLQAALCAIVQCLVIKLDKSVILGVADNIMTQLLRVLQERNASHHEEAFLAIGSVASSLESDFTKYMEALKPFLITALRNFQAYQLCKIAVATVTDICTSIEGAVQPYCDEIMQALIECLKDSAIHRSVKPPVLACFGEIAMAIGAAYEPYLQLSAMLLMQASSAKIPDETDEDLIEYFNTLRESILDAYIGIIQGLQDGNLIQHFVQYVPSVLQFLQLLAADPHRDEMVLNKSIGVIGDIARSMGPQIKQQLNQPFVADLLNEGAASGDVPTAQVATWARGIVQQVVQS